MPLLGRHKSPSGNSSSGSQQQASNNNNNNNTATTSSQGRRAQQPLCESPLFGTRRQLPLGDVSAAGSGSGATGGGKQATATGAAAGAAAESLSSVPQQITRQQINYAFSIMDTNKDGMIDLRDLSQMLANLGVPIDEAILSHIMSSVSKRGDHRISEAEFLDWISRFIQVSDSPTIVGGSSGRRRPTDQRQQQQPSAPGRRRLPGLAGATGSGGPNSPTGSARSASRVARSSTAGSSLAAAQPSPDQVAALRNRRGSGSGLALMRSLSTSNAARGSSPSSSPEPRTPGEASSDTSAERRGRPASSGSGSGELAGSSQASADLEARNDLKAAFGVFDLDGDGFITIDEVRAGLKLLGESWSPSELQNVFNRCSGGGGSGSDGLSGKRISIDDFVHLLL